MFITKKVFDPELVTKAVFLKTNQFDKSGVYIVSHADNEDLYLVDHTSIVTKYHISFFNDEENDLQVLELPQPIEEVETLPVIRFVEPPKKKHKAGFKRKQGAKNYRSDLQIKVDNNHLEYLLQENIEPLKLEDIIKRMQENHGHWHWNTKNATGFVNYAIKSGKRIKKTGFAFYGFDWEAAR